ncbi:hypothetical protein [Pseudomonas sp. CCOS 191]|uniref:hypothetical protein n=1 Tax=Pseudomonas sp. CCOS 191 TaxID=1649877 RepID=UPI0012E018FE|nr:hypothetical protein [Pseudomonas sp. CCOS 191]
MDAQLAVERIRALATQRVVTFLGFSDAGYEREAQLQKLLLSELSQFNPAQAIVCAGATASGIGMVYSLAQQMGFRTVGIVSSLALAQGTARSPNCQHVFVIDDETWGGRQTNGQLSSTSQAMIDASDVMIGIGGGAITRDELEEGRSRGKIVRFHPADMNHARAMENAAQQGKPPPLTFGGDAQTLFQDQQGEERA